MHTAAAGCHRQLPGGLQHWVDRDELPALEYVMQRRVGRTNVGVMMAGQGGGTADVFAMTTHFLKEREQR